MSYQQRTIGEICSELLEEAIRIGYSKRYVWGQLSKHLSIIRGYYRNHHICTFSIEATEACLASYRNKYEQGITSRTSFKDLSAAVRLLKEYALTGELSIITHNKRTPEPLPPYFESVLDRFIHYANYKENTVNDVDWVLRKYLRFFSGEGHSSLADASMEDVRSFIMKTAMEVKNSTLHDIFLYRETARLKCPEVPEHIHPHMWRHTRAMHLYQHGMPLELVAQWLGHRNPTTTLVYAYVDTEHKRKAIEKAMEHSRVTTGLSSSAKQPAYQITDEELLKRLHGLD